MGSREADLVATKHAVLYLRKRQDSLQLCLPRRH